MTEQIDKHTGMALTFYSYKGGVGRSFALANCAALLARWGFRVICLDWDLEAPGLNYYFEADAQRPGILDWIIDDQLSWQSCVQTPEVPLAEGRLDLISAGHHDKDCNKSSENGYYTKLQQLDWQDAYEENDLGQRVEDLRNKLLHRYDFVLIDSRTGITDIGGVCGIQMPDVVIMLTTANHQSLQGTLDVAARLVAGRSMLVYDRPALKIVPILSRFDAREEYELSEQWRQQSAEQLEPLFQSWIAHDEKPMTLRMLNFLSVPYISRWSFGEKLAVAEELEPSPEYVTYSMQNLAALIANKLQDTTQAVWRRDEYVSRAMTLGERALTRVSPERQRYDVFLSYSHKDSPFVRDLVQQLKFNGLTVWDTDQISPGDSPRIEIKRHMTNSKVIVPILGTAPSHDQMNELKMANELVFSSISDHVMLPLLVGDVGTQSRGLPSFIHSLRTHSVNHPREPEEVSFAADEITRLVKSRSNFNPV